MAVPSAEGGYVTILPPTEVTKLEEKISLIPLGDAEAQEEIAVYMSRAQTFAFDKQGRIALNDELLQHAGITKEAILVGSMSKFNVYSPEVWNTIQQKRAATGAGGFLRKYQI